MSKPPTELLKGTLDMLILRTLDLEPRHGLGVADRIEQITQGTFRVKPGSLFPALHRLEQRGFIEGAWERSPDGGRGKYYRLTPGAANWTQSGAHGLASSWPSARFWNRSERGRHVMRWLTTLQSLSRTVSGSSRLERDLDAELRQYVDRVAERQLRAGMSPLRQYVDRVAERQLRAGMSPAAARRAALAEVEGVEQTKEKVRDARVGAGIESVLRDLRLAARGLRRNPGFALGAILTLALGIGATVAIFSSVRAVLLRPLPYAEPDRLVFIEGERDGEAAALSPGRLIDLRQRAQGFTGVAGFYVTPVNIVGAAGPERLLAETVSTDLFHVLGVAPFLGRTFEVGREHQRAVVLSYGLWQRRFGGDRSIVGREIAFDSGVTP
jgi:DNA-binding PadR family transcriptional regulator